MVVLDSVAFECQHRWLPESSFSGRAPPTVPLGRGPTKPTEKEEAQAVDPLGPFGRARSKSTPLTGVNSYFEVLNLEGATSNVQRYK